MIRIIPYRQGSRSAAALAQALGGRVLKLEGSRYRYRDGDKVINWGNNNHGFTFPRIYNNAVERATNKLTFFQAMESTGLVPDFWTSPADIPDEAFPIVCRTVLNGHSGNGIVIADRRDDLVPAPLYVKYVKKASEYRIHVGQRSVFVGLDDHRSTNGYITEEVVISRQQKVRRQDVEPTDWRVRNLDNGFVFQRQGIEVPMHCIQAAKTTIACLGLDFGAVDVIWNTRQSRSFVLEVNTAPGLEGQTVTDYAEFFS
jgi:glutathione synthase/RimK-type ligase-like ATP-grasp enzyme